jgi:hypothetical protein
MRNPILTIPTDGGEEVTTPGIGIDTPVTTRGALITPGRFIQRLATSRSVSFADGEHDCYW